MRRGLESFYRGVREAQEVRDRRVFLVLLPHLLHPRPEGLADLKHLAQTHQEHQAARVSLGPLAHPSTHLNQAALDLLLALQVLCHHVALKVPVRLSDPLGQVSPACQANHAVRVCRLIPECRASRCVQAALAAQPSQATLVYQAIRACLAVQESQAGLYILSTLEAQEALAVLAGLFFHDVQLARSRLGHPAPPADLSFLGCLWGKYA